MLLSESCLIKTVHVHYSVSKQFHVTNTTYRGKREKNRCLARKINLGIFSRKKIWLLQSQRDEVLRLNIFYLYSLLVSPNFDFDFTIFAVRLYYTL